MAKKTNKSIYVAAFALFAVGLGYLIFSGVSSGSLYFVNVSEALAMEPAKLTSARLFGVVAPTGIESHTGAPGVSFVLVDKDDTASAIAVDYSGVVPDTFKPGVDVIVEGGFDTSQGVFSAATLMTKCPSKYKKMREEELEEG